jgi:hypothetical protein
MALKKHCIYVTENGHIDLGTTTGLQWASEHKRLRLFRAITGYALPFKFLPRSRGLFEILRAPAFRFELVKVKVRRGGHV